MTNIPFQRNAPTDTSAANSTSGRASWIKSSTPVGSTTFDSPAPGVAGADQHRGAQVRGASAQPQTEAGEAHACHSPSCAHASTTTPSRARPRVRQKRQHLTTTRFNDEELVLAKKAAGACEMTLSGFLAHATLAAARDLDRTASDLASDREMAAELFAARRHLAQIGNNVNQVAKVLNSGGNAPHAAAVLRAVVRAADRVRQAADHFLDT